jgi:hypothetical protein
VVSMRRAPGRLPRPDAVLGAVDVVPDGAFTFNTDRDEHASGARQLNHQSSQTPSVVMAAASSFLFTYHHGPYRDRYP